MAARAQVGRLPAGDDDRRRQGAASGRATRSNGPTKVPEIARRDRSSSDCRAAALDGELIAGTRHASRTSTCCRRRLSGEQQGTLVYVLFDLLHIDGIDDRRVRRWSSASSCWQTCSPIAPRHLAFSTHIDRRRRGARSRWPREQHFEGIISKRADQPYHARPRRRLAQDQAAGVATSSRWSATRRARAVARGFGSLLLARPDPDEHGWVYAGRVGSGFTDEQMRDSPSASARRQHASRPCSVAAIDADLRGALWFEPAVRGRGVRPRHRQLGRAAPAVAEGAAARQGRRRPADSDRGHAGTRTAATRRRPQAREDRSTRRRRPTITHHSARAASSSRQQHHQAAGRRLLPRGDGPAPARSDRRPPGRSSAARTAPAKPASSRSTTRRAWSTSAWCALKEEAGNNANYLVVDDAAGVMELVQFNALEFHPWGSHADDPDIADRVVFDLDPGPNVPWTRGQGRGACTCATCCKQTRAGVVPAHHRRQGPARGGAAESRLRLGTVKPFAQAFADALAQAPAAGVRRHRQQAATQRQDLRRLPAQRPRRDRVASYSLRARPARRWRCRCAGTSWAS